MAAEPVLEEICEPPSDSLAEKICWQQPKDLAPTRLTNYTYTLALINGGLNF